MRKIVLLTGIVLLLGFIVLQFFQPDKNTSEITSAHIFQQVEIPGEMQTLISESCLDCHSNNTRYTWYHFVPVAWMVNKHIEKGKKELNFSEWANMDVYKRITILEEMCQEVERHTMPLKSYRTIHPKARLSDEQIAAFCAWTTSLAEELLSKDDM